MPQEGVKVLEEKELKDMAYYLLEIAKFHLKKDGHVEPVGFLFTEEGMKGAVLRFEDRESKNACIEKFKELAKEHKAYAAILITEAWMAKVSNLQTVAMAEIIGTEYMPGRTEQIHVTVIAPNLRMCIAQEIDTSDEANPIVVGEPYEMEGNLQGRMFEGLWDVQYGAVQMKPSEVN